MLKHNVIKLDSDHSSLTSHTFCCLLQFIIILSRKVLSIILLGYNRRS